MKEARKALRSCGLPCPNSSNYGVWLEGQFGTPSEESSAQTFAVYEAVKTAVQAADNAQWVVYETTAKAASEDITGLSSYAEAKAKHDHKACIEQVAIAMAHKAGICDFAPAVALNLAAVEAGEPMPYAFDVTWRCAQQG